MVNDRNKLEKFQKKIDKKRRELDMLIEHSNEMLDSKKILKISRQLDSMIVEYMQLKNQI